MIPRGAIGILIGSPEIQRVTMRILTTSKMRSMQMMKKELIRSQLFIRVGNQGATLILILSGQETIHGTSIKILKINMIVLNIGVGIKTEDLDFSITKNIKMTHCQKDLDLVKVLDILKIWKVRDIGIEQTEILKMRKEIIVEVQEAKGISLMKSLWGIEVSQFQGEMTLNIARVKVIRVT